MPITVKVGELLNSEAEGVFINIDPTASNPMSGGANNLSKRVGVDAWEKVLEQVKLPFPNTHARRVDLNSPEVHFKHVLFLGAIDHLAPAEGHRSLLQGALRSGLILAKRSGLSRIATYFSRAGWRLTPVNAAYTLAGAWDQARVAGLELEVWVADKETAAELRQILR